MNKEIEKLVSKYTKIIHPQDTGKETNALENTLRNLIEEITQQERERIIKKLECFRNRIDFIRAHFNTNSYSREYRNNKEYKEGALDAFKEIYIELNSLIKTLKK